MKPDEIKSLRLFLGDTQAQFLERLGIGSTNSSASRQVVSRWERGRREPKKAVLILLEQLCKKARWNNKLMGGKAR